MDNNEILLNSKVEKIYIKYLFNSIVGMLAVSFCILVDTMFIGRGIGSQGLAALNICIPIFNVFNGIGLLFGMGGATAFSISRGRNDEDEANKIFSQTITTAFVVGITISFIGSNTKTQIAYLLGADNTTIKLVTEYLSGVLFLSFSYILSHTTSSFVRNDHNTKLVMVSTTIAGLLNIVLDYLFIFTFDMGMKGAAFATSLASVINVCILSSHFMTHKCNLEFISFKFNISRLIRVLKNGGPSFIIELSSGIIIFIFNLSLLKMIGDIGVSAYSIIANVALVVSSIFTGIAQAIQPIISINYGAYKIDRVEKVKRLALVTALIVGVIFYLSGLLFPNKIVSIFTSEKGEIVAITVNAIKYYFVAFLVMGLNIVMGVYYQSKEHTIVSNIISLERGIVFLAVGIFTLPWIFGVNGIWLSAVFSEIMTLICIFIYINFDKYRKRNEL